MSKYPSISAAFRQLVTDTEAAIQEDTTVVFPTDVPKKLYFMQGNVMEVSGQLLKLTKSPQHKGKKFPLVVLFRDIKEGIEDTGIKFKAHFAIFTLTQETYSSDEREVKTFNPILRPIFEEIVNQLQNSAAFNAPSLKELAIEKYDCFFYGSVQNNKNPFGDRVDAIDVTSISLSLNNNC